MIAERLDGTEPPEVIERHKDRYRKAIELAESIGGVWWDVACGTGYGTEMMPADVRVGFDRVISGYARLALFLPQDSTTFVKTDITQAGWSSEAFDTPDVILCIETLEHLNRYEQDGFIRELAHRLHPDGVLVIACPIGDGPSANPWHLHEPSETDLYELLFRYFGSVWVGINAYESTSGPALQGYATARVPR